MTLRRHNTGSRILFFSWSGFLLRWEWSVIYIHVHLSHYVSVVKSVMGIFSNACFMGVFPILLYNIQSILCKINWLIVQFTGGWRKTIIIQFMYVCWKKCSTCILHVDVKDNVKCLGLDTFAVNNTWRGLQRTSYSLWHIMKTSFKQMWHFEEFN